MNASESQSEFRHWRWHSSCSLAYEMFWLNLILIFIDEVRNKSDFYQAFILFISLLCLFYKMTQDLCLLFCRHYHITMIVSIRWCSKLGLSWLSCICAINTQQLLLVLTVYLLCGLLVPTFKISWLCQPEQDVFEIQIGETSTWLCMCTHEGWLDQIVVDSFTGTQLLRDCRLFLTCVLSACRLMWWPP